MKWSAAVTVAALIIMALAYRYVGHVVQAALNGDLATSRRASLKAAFLSVLGGIMFLGGLCARPFLRY